MTLGSVECGIQPSVFLARNTMIILSFCSPILAKTPPKFSKYLLSLGTAEYIVSCVLRIHRENNEIPQKKKGKEEKQVPVSHG